MSAHEHTLAMENHRREVFAQGRTDGQRIRDALASLPAEIREAASLAVGTAIAQNYVERTDVSDITTHAQGMWYGIEDERILSVAKRPIVTEGAAV